MSKGGENSQTIVIVFLSVATVIILVAYGAFYFLIKQRRALREYMYKMNCHNDTEHAAHLHCHDHVHADSTCSHPDGKNTAEVPATASAGAVPAISMQKTDNTATTLNPLPLHPKIQGRYQTPPGPGGLSLGPVRSGRDGPRTPDGRDHTRNVNDTKNAKASSDSCEPGWAETQILKKDKGKRRQGWTGYKGTHPGGCIKD